MSLVNKFEEIQAGKALVNAIEEAYATSVKPGARFKQNKAPTNMPSGQQQTQDAAARQKWEQEGDLRVQQARRQAAAQQQTASQQPAPQNIEQMIISFAKEEMNREQVLYILKSELRRRGG